MLQPVDEKWMQLALELAAQGEGLVEPNPMVGCVLVRDDREIGRGFHERFGGAHAEINALRTAENPRGATAYVTLEPCCHTGKTGPCTVALIQAGIRRVVVATSDPFPQVDGGGIRQLSAAGVQVDVGILERQARDLNAPYLKRLRTGRPWVIAKWAMSLDGKIATPELDSQWISGESARDFVHQLRGRMDAIIVGSGTAQVDNPRLTARPFGRRIATRVIFDSRLQLSADSQLVRTIGEAPILLVADRPDPHRRRELELLGCQIHDVQTDNPGAAVESALDELGKRGMTNVMVEGGGQLLGSFFDANQIDECIAIIAPKLLGGGGSPSPIAGLGISKIADAARLSNLSVASLGQDICLRGRVLR